MVIAVLHKFRFSGIDMIDFTERTVSSMMKAVAPVLALLGAAAVLGGCALTPTGSVAELTRCAWSATLDGEGYVRLSFADDRAALTLKNGGDRQDIAGSFVADETDIVIFDRDCARYYAFTYVPKGNALDLSYQGGTVTLRAESGTDINRDE